MITFKQYLNELTLNIDPDADPDDQLQGVRQAQLIAKRSPERVIRTQLQTARDQKAAAMKSTTGTAALDVQIAKKNEELANLEQKRQAMVKRQVPATQQNPANPNQPIGNGVL